MGWVEGKGSGLCIADTMSFGTKHGRQIVAELILYLPLLLEGDSLVVERHGTLRVRAADESQLKVFQIISAIILS